MGSTPAPAPAPAAPGASVAVCAGRACVAAIFVILSYDSGTVNGGPTTGIGQSSGNAAVIIALVILLGILGLLVALFVRSQRIRREGLDTPLLRAFCQDFGVPTTEPAMRLIHRYLQRTDRFRQSWTWIGIGASIAMSYLWQGSSTTHWGLVAYPPTSNVVLMALGFWFVGLVRSELYNIRPRYYGPRFASLEVRAVRRYLPARMIVLPRLTVVMALGIVLADQLLPHPSPHPAVVVGLWVTSLLVLIVTEACQKGIAHRSRPVVAEDLRAADEAIRAMASWSVAYGAAGLITLLAAFEAILVSQEWFIPSTAGGPATASATGALTTTSTYTPRELFLWLAIVLFLWAVGLAWQARRMVQPEPRTRGRAAAEVLR